MDTVGTVPTFIQIINYQIKLIQLSAYKERGPRLSIYTAYTSLYFCTGDLCTDLSTDTGRKSNQITLCDKPDVAHRHKEHIQLCIQTDRHRIINTFALQRR